MDSEGKVGGGGDVVFLDGGLAFYKMITAFELWIEIIGFI